VAHKSRKEKGKSTQQRKIPSKLIIKRGVWDGNAPIDWPPGRGPDWVVGGFCAELSYKAKLKVRPISAGVLEGKKDLI